VRPGRKSRVHFEEDTHRKYKGSGVVGSDEDICMNSQGEEDEEEVNETPKGKRKARTEVRMDSQDEEAHSIETGNRASSFFRLSNI
jgi:hypothetical protein